MAIRLVRSPSLKSPIRQLLWQFAANTAAAALVPVMLLLIGIRAGSDQLWRSFIESVLYANVIGFAAAWCIPRMYPGPHRKGILRRGDWWEWPAVIAVLTVLSVAGCLVVSALLIMFGLFRWEQYWALVGSSIRLCVFITLAGGLIITAFGRLRGRLDQEEFERERAQKLAAEARLSSLESRLHPHFLFNTLNSVSALIPVDPERAERLIERMSALLRFSLDSSHRGMVPLEQELKIVRDYLEIEQVRLASRLRYSIESDTAADVQVPPLSIQTLVENSIKHAIAPGVKGGEVRVSVKCSGTGVEIEVSDTGTGFSMRDLPEGHGLDTLRKRLEVLYGAGSQLHTEHRDEWASVRMLLPSVKAV